MVQHTLPPGVYGITTNLTNNLPNANNYPPHGSPSRKQRQVLIRDSQARLGKVGKPGSKRYQRYMNKSYLYEHEWDLQPEDFEVAQKHPSPFSLLFKTRQQLFAPFLDITEEEQEKLFMELEQGSPQSIEQEDEFGDFVMIPSENEPPVVEKEVEIPSFPAEHHFRRVDKKIRKFIQKNRTNPFLLSLDCQIVEYVKHPTYQPKTFSFQEPFHRMVCHGICQFYSLVSKSQDVSNSRVVIVRKSTKIVAYPTITLSQFLESL